VQCLYFLLILAFVRALDIQRPLLSSAESLDVLALHKSLVEIESISGNEKEVGDWLSGYLQDHGFKVEKQQVAENSFNVFAYVDGHRDSKLLVTSHIDTVRFSS